MGGLSLNLEDLYYGNSSMKLTKDSLMELSSILDGIDISGVELSTANLLNNAKGIVRNIMDGTVNDLISRLENTKDLIVESDQTAALLFSMLDGEYLTEMGEIDQNKLMLDMMSIVSKQDDFFNIADEYNDVILNYENKLNEINNQISIYNTNKKNYDVYSTTSWDYNLIKTSLEKINEANAKIPELENQRDALIQSMTMLKVLRDYSLESAYSLYTQYDDFEDVVFNGNKFSENYKYSEQLSYFTDEEVKIAKYLLNTDANDRLEQYFQLKQDVVNQRIGLELANEVMQKIINNDNNISTTALLAYEGFGDGIVNFFEGIKNLFVADGVLSPEQYKTSFLIQKLQEHYDEEQFMSLFTTATYEISNSIGNMTPSMLVSYITKNPKLGTTLMGLSAAGNAREQGLQSGMTNFESWMYGALSGSSEAVIGYFLGGIPGLNRIDEVAEIPGLKGYIAKLFMEGTEESTQSILEPVFASVAAYASGEKVDSIKIDWNDVLKSGIYGMITAGLLNGGQLVNSNNTAPTINFEIGDKLYNIDPKVGQKLIEKYDGQDLTDPKVLNKLQNDLEKYAINLNSDNSEAVIFGDAIDKSETSANQSNGLMPAGDLEASAPSNPFRTLTSTDLETNQDSSNGLMPAGDLETSANQSNGLMPAGDLEASLIASTTGGFTHSLSSVVDSKLNDMSTNDFKSNSIFSDDGVSSSHYVTRLTEFDLSTVNSSDELVSLLFKSNSIKANEARDRSVLSDWLLKRKNGYRTLYSSPLDVKYDDNVLAAKGLVFEGGKVISGTPIILEQQLPDGSVFKRKKYKFDMKTNEEMATRGKFDYRITMTNSNQITTDEIGTFLETFISEANKRNLNLRAKSFCGKDLFILYCDSSELLGTVSLLEDLKNSSKYGNLVSSAIKHFGPLKQFSASVGADSYYGISMAHSESDMNLYNNIVSGKIKSNASGYYGGAPSKTFGGYMEDSILESTYIKLLDKYNGDVSKITENEFYDEMVKAHKKYMLGSESVSDDIPFWMNRRNYYEFIKTAANSNRKSVSGFESGVLSEVGVDLVHSNPLMEAGSSNPFRTLTSADLETNQDSSNGLMPAGDLEVSAPSNPFRTLTNVDLETNHDSSSFNDDIRLNNAEEDALWIESEDLDIDEDGEYELRDGESLTDRIGIQYFGGKSNNNAASSNGIFGKIFQRFNSKNMFANSSDVTIEQITSDLFQMENIVNGKNIVALDAIKQAESMSERDVINILISNKYSNVQKKSVALGQYLRGLGLSFSNNGVRSIYDNLLYKLSDTTLDSVEKTKIYEILRSISATDSSFKDISILMKYEFKIKPMNEILDVKARNAEFDLKEFYSSNIMESNGAVIHFLDNQVVSVLNANNGAGSHGAASHDILTAVYGFDYDRNLKGTIKISGIGSSMLSANNSIDVRLISEGNSTPVFAVSFPKRISRGQFELFKSYVDRYGSTLSEISHNLTENGGEPLIYCFQDEVQTHELSDLISYAETLVDDSLKLVQPKNVVGSTIEDLRTDVTENDDSGWIEADDLGIDDEGYELIEGESLRGRIGIQFFGEKGSNSVNKQSDYFYSALETANNMSEYGQFYTFEVQDFSAIPNDFWSKIKDQSAAYFRKDGRIYTFDEARALSTTSNDKSVMNYTISQIQSGIDAVDAVYGRNTAINQLFNYIRDGVTGDINLLSPVGDFRNIISKIDYKTLVECYNSIINSQSEVRTIKDEILEIMPQNIDDIAKMRFLYLELNKRVSYDYGYFSFERYSDEEKAYYSKNVTFENLTDNKVICKSWSQLYRELLLSAGFSADIVKIRGFGPSGTHKWVEIDCGDFIIRADATDGFNHTIDLSTAKSGSATNGFIIIDKELAGVNINSKRDVEIMVDGEKMYQRKSVYDDLVVDDTWLRSIDTRLGYATDGKYFDEIVDDLAADFYSPSIVERIFGKKKEKVEKSKYDYFINLSIPSNMNAYDAYVYLNQLKHILFGKINKIQLCQYFKTNPNSFVPFGVTTILKANDDGTIWCRIIDDQSGIFECTFNDIGHYDDYMKESGYY